MVEMRVRRTPSGLEVLGPVRAAEAPKRANEPRSPVLLGGKPLGEVVALEDRGPRPGLVMDALVPYSAQDPRRPRRHCKLRPVVIVSVEAQHVVVRGVYSRNAVDRGSRLHDFKAAGLDKHSVVAHEDTLIPLKHLQRNSRGYRRRGRLSQHDRSRLGIPPPRSATP